MRLVGLTLLCSLLSACASFGPHHEQSINPALESQALAISDPLFAEILMELDEAGAVVWTERLNAAALEEAQSFDSKMSWFLAKYSSEGGLDQTELRPWRKWTPPWSATIAKFNRGLVYLNLNQFDADEFALANTFVHEKNHSFGLIHDRSQTRLSNYCDAGYLAGDLAEALLRSAANNTGSTRHVPTCPALCDELEKRGLWSACEASTTTD